MPGWQSGPMQSPAERQNLRFESEPWLCIKIPDKESKIINIDNDLKE